MDVQQNARPATADEPMVPNTPARGKERRSPILNDYGTFSSVCVCVWRGGDGVKGWELVNEMR